MISWLQKASMLGRCGEGGIRCLLIGDCGLSLDGLDGGVRGRATLLGLCTFPDLGGELDFHQ